MFTAAATHKRTVCSVHNGVDLEPGQVAYPGSDLLVDGVDGLVRRSVWVVVNVLQVWEMYKIKVVLLFKKKKVGV